MTPLRCRLLGHSWRFAYPGGIYGARIQRCRRCRATRQLQGLTSASPAATVSGDRGGPPERR
jgi:hypothetical protein